MKRVRLLVALALLGISSIGVAEVKVLLGESAEQSRDSVHTYLFETEALIPSQWRSLVSGSCCIVSQVGRTNRVFVTAAPEMLDRLADDLLTLERVAETDGNLQGAIASIASYYKGSDVIDITPQASESRTFAVTDSRVSMPVIMAVLRHFPQANFTQSTNGRPEIAAMAINEKQIRQLLAAAVQ